MTREHDTRRRAPGRLSPDPAPATLLWLGPTDLLERLPLQAIGRSLPGLPPVRDIEPLELAHLPARLSGKGPPDAVLSPLFWRDGDVMEAARKLYALDYRGPYRIVSPPLPRPAMVETEVQAVAPGLDVAVIPLPRR